MGSKDHLNPHNSTLTVFVQRWTVLGPIHTSFVFETSFRKASANCANRSSVARNGVAPYRSPTIDKLYGFLADPNKSKGRPAKLNRRIGLTHRVMCAVVEWLACCTVNSEVWDSNPTRRKLDELGYWWRGEHGDRWEEEGM